MKMLQRLQDVLTSGLTGEEKDLWRKWMIISLGFHLAATYFNIGYHQADEHFQVLEFASYKLGFTPERDLAWEFENKMRPALQPFVAYIIGKGLLSLNLYSPFTLTFLLRLIGSALNFIAVLFLIKHTVTGLGQKQSRRFFLWASFGLWFLPYLHGRFSGESLSAAFFTLGLCIFINSSATNRQNSISSYFVTGALWGFAFLFRYQMAFGIIGIGLWILILGRISIVSWMMMAFGFIAALGVGMLADLWFYGTIEPVAWNYFRINILEHKAAEFGVQPSWWYVTEFLSSAAPPISLALLAAVAVACWKSFRHPAIWPFVVFILGHTAVGHKEMRFLFPLVLLLPLIAALGVEGLLCSEKLRLFWEEKKEKYLFKGIRWTLLGVNGLLIVISSIRPANETAPVYQAIYKEFQNLPSEKRVIYGYQATFYGNVGLNASFYKPEGLLIERVETKESLAKIALEKGEIWVVSEGGDRSKAWESVGLKSTVFAQTVPEWMAAFNINDWLSRTAMSRVYKVKNLQEKN